MNNKISNSKIPPAMNKHTVAYTIAELGRDYGHSDIHVSDVISVFLQRLRYDYPDLGRDEFVAMIDEALDPKIEMDKEDRDKEQGQ
jgi:hypothetical protein